MPPVRCFRLLHAAEQERDQAVDHYDAERFGLGYEFFDRYEEAVRNVLEFPHMGSKIEDIPSRYTVRRYVFNQFDCDLITAVVDDELVIVAIAAHAREPGYWKERLKEL